MFSIQQIPSYLCSSQSLHCKLSNKKYYTHVTRLSLCFWLDFISLHVNDYYNIYIPLIFIQYRTFNGGLQWKLINRFLFLRATTSYLSSHGGSPGSPAQLPGEYAAEDTFFNADAISHFCFSWSIKVFSSQVPTHLLGEQWQWGLSDLPKVTNRKCSGRVSNPRPLDWEANTLTTTLSAPQFI